MEIVCTKCGSIYELSSKSYHMLDKDTINCEVCGNKLYSWTEPTIWEVVLIEKNENHLK